jgi:hypothetical protein
MSTENKEILPNITNIKTHETYTLPSKGLVYKEGDGIPASVTLRRMTTKEDKIRLRNQSEDRIRKDLLQACILEQGVDAGKLKLMDANFLLFRLRALSLLDDTYKVTCRCPRCSTQFVHQVNLSEIPVKYFNEEKLADMKVKLPINEACIDFKYPSLNEMINMGDNLRNYFDKFPDADRNEALYTISTILYIDKINGHSLLSEELEKWVDDLDIIDSRALKDIINRLDDVFGFDDNIECACPTCKETIVHGLPITNELFNPSN